MRRQELAQRLSGLEGFEEPRVTLEQYVTPPDLAADLLYTAYMQGDIEGKEVADLGAGTGVLAVGAAMLGAEVEAVEKDASALETAHENAEEAGVEDRINFVEKDVADYRGRVATVVMNPPFSVHSEEGDKFFRTALSISSAVYTLISPDSRERIKDFAGQSSHEIRAVEEYSISIPPVYRFHTEESRDTRVDLVVTRREDEP